MEVAAEGRSQLRYGRARRGPHLWTAPPRPPPHRRRRTGPLRRRRRSRGAALLPRRSAADPVTGHLYVARPQPPHRRVHPLGGIRQGLRLGRRPGAVNETQEVRVRAGAEPSSSASKEPKPRTCPSTPRRRSAGRPQRAADDRRCRRRNRRHRGARQRRTATPFLYVVAFKGSLAGTNVEQLSAEDGATPLSEGNPSPNWKPAPETTEPPPAPASSPAPPNRAAGRAQKAPGPARRSLSTARSPSAPKATSTSPK